ncbi:MAG TPA: prepilin-type N-terminal cleavage/methylation domain-containing protein [Phycisphaerae bacterium]|nr:prepilin-type N-terminal cleavage/methylation domain-containing protein [Phycisphaerae bacterium]
MSAQRHKFRAFTLIELLVVVAVIALLISILIPSLGKARSMARATKCGAQLNSVGKAVAGYLAENAGTYPPCYWYPNADGSYDFMNQNASHPAGYAHWSSFLFGYAKDLRAFTCPEFENGGLSRTNPGPYQANWTGGQVDQNGNTGPSGSSIQDVQAPFMAFTANAAIMPRNKFTAAVAMADGGNGQRLSVFLRQGRVKQESGTILMTEFNSRWQTISAIDSSSGNRVIKSHRPLSPFIGAGGGSDEFSVPFTGQFARPDINDLYDKTQLASHEGAGDSLITDPQTQLNAVGRQHPGGYSAGGRNFGGTANFIYMDGHIERKNVAQTMGAGGAWEWGDAYYTITGNTSVR